MKPKIVSKIISCKGIKYYEIEHPKYKYMLAENYRLKLDRKPLRGIVTKWFTLDTSGWLIIKKGYCWDGCSGPARDDETNMRAGLVHDWGYQAIREGIFPSTFKNRLYVDNLFYDILIEDGMFILRAKYYWLGVRAAGWLHV